MAYTREELERVGSQAAMAFLIELCDRRDTANYADVARYIGLHVDERFFRSWHHIGFLVGSLMDRILKFYPDAPPINSLVLGPDKLPGTGADIFVAEYLNADYSKFSDVRKRAALKPVHENVWAFENWRDVAKRVFGKNVELPEAPVREEDGKSKRMGFGGPSESPEHRRLKEYVAANPAKFRAPKGSKKGMLEYRLESTDEIDVYFMYPGQELAVEVKSTRSTEADHRRGIFQCVKYRAILDAQSRVVRSTSNVRVMLVTEISLGKKLSRWASMLGVEVIEIPPRKSTTKKPAAERDPFR